MSFDMPDDIRPEDRDMYRRIQKMKAMQEELGGKGYALYKEKGPDRETVIGEEDISNLKIMLGNIDNIDDFLKAM